MTKKKRIIIYLSITIMGLLSLLITIYASMPVRKNYVEVFWAIDIDNTEVCAKEAENVFIGEVIKKVGNTISTFMPENQFEVHVEENIKGNLQGNVIVNQSGGYNIFTKTIVLYDGDTLIEEGETYLFTTTCRGEYHKSRGWHQVKPIGGKIKVKDEEHKKELIEKFKKIKPQ